MSKTFVRGAYCRSGENSLFAYLIKSSKIFISEVPNIISVLCAVRFAVIAAPERECKIQEKRGFARLESIEFTEFENRLRLFMLYLWVKESTAYLDASNLGNKEIKFIVYKQLGLKMFQSFSRDFSKFLRSIVERIVNVCFSNAIRVPKFVLLERDIPGK